LFSSWIARREAAHTGGHRLQHRACCQTCPLHNLTGVWTRGTHPSQPHSLVVCARSMASLYRGCHVVGTEISNTLHDQAAPLHQGQTTADDNGVSTPWRTAGIDRCPPTPSLPCRLSWHKTCRGGQGYRVQLLHMHQPRPNSWNVATAARHAACATRLTLPWSRQPQAHDKRVPAGRQVGRDARCIWTPPHHTMQGGGAR
jgi:hypothetical protein